MMHNFPCSQVSISCWSPTRRQFLWLE
jgi:hypothetical protein